MIRADRAAMGHDVLAVATVAGDMNAIQFHGLPEVGARGNPVGWRKGISCADACALAAAQRTCGALPSRGPAAVQHP
jgi:hypothetical protein